MGEPDRRAQHKVEADARGSVRDHRRVPGGLLAVLGMALTVGSLFGVPWFTDSAPGCSGRAGCDGDFTELGPAEFGRVAEITFIGSLSETEGLWIRGAFFVLAGAFSLAFSLSSLPRSKTSRIVAGATWLVLALFLLATLPVLVQIEIRRPEQQSGSSDSVDLTGPAIIGVVAVACLVAAWVSYRGRTVGCGVAGVGVAALGAAVHIFVLIRLISGTGDEGTTMGVGPWMVLAGLLALVGGGGLLTRAAAGYRATRRANMRS